MGLNLRLGAALLCVACLVLAACSSRDEDTKHRAETRVEPTPQFGPTPQFKQFDPCGTAKQSIYVGSGTHFSICVDMPPDCGDVPSMKELLEGKDHVARAPTQVTPKAECRDHSPRNH